MKDGIFGLVTGFFLGAFATVLFLSFRLGFWFEEVDDEPLDD